MDTTWSEHFGQVFTPHGHCYLWRTDLLLLHSLSDAAIGVAYFSIPLALWVFVKKRRDLAFNWMFMLFAVFIFSCGTTHFYEVWNNWNADYYQAGIVKAFTAVVSLATAALLWPLIPKAMALPSAQALQDTNDQLHLEIQRRHAVEHQLRQASDMLEQRVAERTRDLEAAKQALETAVAEARQNHAQLEAVFQAIHDGIAVFDTEGRLVMMNAAITEVNGVPEGVNIRESLDYFKQTYELFLPDGSRVDVADWPLNRVLRGEILDEWELEGHRIDTGQRWYFSYSGQPVYDASGQLVLAVLVRRDIGERRLMERAR